MPEVCGWIEFSAIPGRELRGGGKKKRKEGGFFDRRRRHGFESFERETGKRGGKREEREAPVVALGGEKKGKRSTLGAKGKCSQKIKGGKTRSFGREKSGVVGLAFLFIRKIGKKGGGEGGTYSYPFLR